MCTAIRFCSQAHYFGRNLDLDRFFKEEVCVVPRGFPLAFRRMGSRTQHYAMIGMASVVDGVPLLYDAANEHGLAMAGLNFPGNAFYGPEQPGKDNVAPFEFIPWILGQCKTVAEAEILLAPINLVNISFSESLPLSPLHWILSDRDRCIVVEPMKDGLHIHENPLGVLTNNPPFPHQLANWETYRHLRTDNTQVLRAENLPYSTYCQGLGAVGLPGDVSSMSRFVRVAFGLENALRPEAEAAAVGQFFHLLTSVEMIEGVCKTDAGTWDITGYSACINTEKGRYYYTTYGNRRISCVDMHRTDLDGSQLARFPLIKEESIHYQN